MASIFIYVYNFITIQILRKINRIIMWTEEVLNKAAEKYFEEYYKYDDVYFKRDVINIFTAGAKYVIKNTPKEF